METDRSPTGVRVSFVAEEASLLRQLTDEMLQLLGSDAGRSDPALARLFPDAYEDPTDQQAYSDLVGDSLEQHKRDAVTSVRESLRDTGTVTVDIADDTVDTWLSVLTDLRLTIATRLDVDEERMAAPLDPAAPDAVPLSVLHWLGWVQESLLQAIGT